MTGTTLSWRTVPAIAILFATTALAAPVGAEETAVDPVAARSYAVRFRPIADAAEVVGAVLSAEGEITLRPRLKQIVVKDRVSVLDQIGPLIKSFDLPPRSVDLSISLALGREADAGRALPRDEPFMENRGIFEPLPQITKWTAFDALGKRSVVGVEGSTVTVAFADDYRVVMEIESVEDDVVTFKRVWLQRVSIGPDGEETVQNLYGLKVVTKAGQTRIVGAAQAPDSKKALFISLQADPR